MTAHHLIKEEDAIFVCSRCGKTHPPEFRSVHDLNVHYKEFKCDCGYVTSVKVTPGTGHDSFNEQVSKKVEDLEKENLDSLVEHEKKEE